MRISWLNCARVKAEHPHTLKDLTASGKYLLKSRGLSAGEAVMITHSGGCHCGRVRFEVVAPAVLQVSDCNCSICAKSGYLHLYRAEVALQLTARL
jgi:hypothetical protein